MFILVNEARPNFITSQKVEGEVVNLVRETDEDLMDKIVMIPKADPDMNGYKRNKGIYNKIWWNGKPYGLARR